jgi:hypothetical protein
MRELNFSECEMAGGGIITVSPNGNVTASEGQMLQNPDGSYSIHTNDGWSYYRNADNTWSLWNDEGHLVNSGIYELNPP